MRLRWPRLAALALLVMACSGGADDASSPSTTAGSPVETGSIELGPSERPARLVAPDDVTAPAPLLLLLHGFTATADVQDSYLGVTEEAASRGLYVLLADGTPDADGDRFWDATPACCNYTGTPVDDVGYLRGLIEEAIQRRPIDPDRVYVLGHSNGGFMAYRLACEMADGLTAIAVLSGSDLPDDSCVPSLPVSVLHLHGTADRVIRYEGGRLTAPYPGAVEVVTRWAERAGCDAEPSDGAPLDLVTNLPGAETTVRSFDGCDVSIDVQLDTIEEGLHVPGFDHAAIGTGVLDWLLDHSR